MPSAVRAPVSSRRRIHRLSWLLPELPSNPTTRKGSFMIRLSTKGGVRLRAFARSLAIGLVMLAPLAASAADPGGFTDRIIVKYRNAPLASGSAAPSAATAAAADAQVRGTATAAARLGVQLSRLHAT